jgi:hypothetical protein
MNTKTLSAILTGFVLLASCAAPTAQLPTLQPATATPTLFLSTQAPPSLTLAPGALTPLPGLSATSPVSICSDPQVPVLIDSFKSAVLTSDGMLLSSLVSPARGMDVAYFRDGTVITYLQEHAKFLFETTFEVDWGAEPGSGAQKTGSFHDVVVPELVTAFNQPYTLHCNELKHGGATYELDWPYEGEFYSIYFPGTEANGNLDWHTWVMGIEYVAGKPYVYALMQFFWEP